MDLREKCEHKNIVEAMDENLVQGFFCNDCGVVMQRFFILVNGGPESLGSTSSWAKVIFLVNQFEIETKIPAKLTVIDDRGSIIQVFEVEPMEKECAMEGQLLEAKAGGCGMFIEVNLPGLELKRKLISVDNIVSIEEYGPVSSIIFDNDYVVDVKDSYEYFKEKLKGYIL